MTALTRPCAILVGLLSLLFLARVPAITMPHLHARPVRIASMPTTNTSANVITTVAGGLSGSIRATSSNIASIGIARDPQGDVYVSDLHDQIVRKIDSLGKIVTVAGNDTIGFSGDGGPAPKAQLDGPYGVCLDSAGNIYIADSQNNRIRRVAPTGQITTFAGGAAVAPLNNGDGGPATSASLSDPERVAIDPDGNVYIADVNHGEIRKVDSAGTITTFGGKSGFSLSGDGGPATSATFAGVGGMTWMADGSLLVADTYNHRIRRIDKNGIINTIAGNGSSVDSGDNGPAAVAGLNGPVDVASDGAGGFYIAEALGDRVRHVDAAGIITTLDIPGLLRPQGVVSDGSGGVLISDLNARLVRWHHDDNSNSVVAGNGSASFSGIGIPAIEASLATPAGIAFDDKGNLYIADELNYMVRRVSPSGIITTIAGTGQPPCRTLGCNQPNGDGGRATNAILASPIAVAADHAGNVYIAEYETSLVRRVDPNGVITTFAGGGNGLGDGGPATAAQLFSPRGLSIAPDGSLIIADTFAHRIRRIDTGGIITTIAGNGTGGFAGDGGPATAAGLNHPTAAVYDSLGNLYIADFSNARVRKVGSDGTINTVAGNGQADTGGTGLGDGLPATLATLTGPYAVAVDATGYLYISDQSDDRIRAVDPSGTITTVTGTGKFGYSGDGGPAANAQNWWPSGIALGPTGGLYFADSENNRIRAINAPPFVPLTSVVSRINHGARSFDVDLTADNTTECRRGGAGGNYTLIFTFANTLTNVSGAKVSRGTGQVSQSSIGSDAHQYTVGLTGVADAQRLTIELTGVSDSAGNQSADVSIGFPVLIGDTNGDGTVNSADISQTKSQSGQALSEATFREDLNTDGDINSADISVVKSRSGTALP